MFHDAWLVLSLCRQLPRACPGAPAPTPPSHVHSSLPIITKTSQHNQYVGIHRRAVPQAIPGRQSSRSRPARDQTPLRSAQRQREALRSPHLHVRFTVRNLNAIETDAIYRACFAGTRIVLRQLSPESEPIYDFIIALHKHCNGDYDALAKEVELSKEDLDAYLNYAAQFLGNLGNYKSFGDSKFVRNLRASLHT
jgi:hypothetical protein